MAISGSELRLCGVQAAYKDMGARAHVSTCLHIHAYNHVHTKERVRERPCQSRGSSIARCKFMAHSGVIARQPVFVKDEVNG